MKYTEALKDFETAKAKRKPNDDAPAAPASPYRLCADATVEGLRRDLDTGPCSQGVFTDEAASMLSGYGMSPDHRSKTAGVFSRLWDSGHLSVSRAGGPRVERYGRRIALHWLIQPMAASETISDPMLTSLGFWPRFLTARPEPQLPRLARPFEPGKVASIGAYWRRCSELLARSLPDDATDNAVIRLSDDARAVLSAAFERFERAARGGDLQVIKPFALRAAEQACRIAGVLAAFDDQQVVSRELMLSALNLTTYSLDTWHELINQGAADTGSTVALRLYEWLVQRPSWRERLAVIVKDGPTCVRSKDRRDAAIDLLMEFGLLEIVGGQAQALAPAPEEAP